MNPYPCGCAWDSGPYVYKFCEKHKDEDPSRIEAERDRYRKALEDILLCNAGPAMRLRADAALEARP